jgi:hypothetical protein
MGTAYHYSPVTALSVSMIVNLVKGIFVPQTAAHGARGEVSFLLP